MAKTFSDYKRAGGSLNLEGWLYTRQPKVMAETQKKLQNLLKIGKK